MKIFPIPLPFTSTAAAKEDNSDDSTSDEADGEKELPRYYDDAPKDWGEWYRMLNEGHEPVMTPEQRKEMKKHLLDGGPAAISAIFDTALARYPWLHKLKRGHVFEPLDGEDDNGENTIEDDNNDDTSDSNDVDEGEGLDADGSLDKMEKSDEHVDLNDIQIPGCSHQLGAMSLLDSDNESHKYRMTITDSQEDVDEFTPTVYQSSSSSSFSSKTVIQYKEKTDERNQKGILPPPQPAPHSSSSIDNCGDDERKESEEDSDLEIIQDIPVIKLN